MVGLYVILVLAFGNSRDALLIMLNLPLALIGGVAGVFLSGGVLSVASMIGFITLFGIATRNGIMLVSHIRHVREVEHVADFREAVERAAMQRLVPILMTAMAAGLALVPLAFAAGESGSEIQTPMAIVILCGLTTSTLLNMFVVPTLYLRYGERKARYMRTVHWLFVVSVALFLGGIGFIIATARTVRDVPRPEDPVARPVATVKQLMDGIVGPAAKVVFESVSTTVTAAGKKIRSRAPTPSGKRWETTPSRWRRRGTCS